MILSYFGSCQAVANAIQGNWIQRRHGRKGPELEGRMNHTGQEVPVTVFLVVDKGNDGDNEAMTTKIEKPLFVPMTNGSVDNGSGGRNVWL